MAHLEDGDITFQQPESPQSEAPNDLTSFQFVPYKIVGFSVSQEGQRSYCVRWKDSWLTEELLSLTYQHLINEYWSSDANKNNDKAKSKISKTSNIKIINKQDNYDGSTYQDINGQSTITVTTPSSVQIDVTSNDVHTVSLKDISETAAPTHLIDGDAIIKNSTGLSKIQTLNSSSLSSIVVNSDVSLAASGLQYPDMPPTMLANATIPKYQQALQQPITVQQQHLAENEETGKVTFPKHVFSQARFVNKKQQQQMVASESPRVMCDICQKSLKTKKMLWAHKVAVHYGGNFPCEICGKKCITGAELRRHMTSHSAERKFVCQYCGLAYKRWSHLYQHLRVHEEEKNFRCDVCHLNFKVQSELKDHCFAEHSQGNVVQCSVCKHNLQTPLAVYHHSMKHTGTRDFLCEICNSNFKRKQHLVTHMKTHLTEKKAGDGSDETYECQACDETFQLKMDMKSHCETVHTLPDDESISCKTCHKKLNVSASVYLHGLRHSGARDFKCDECNQLFKRKAHLLRHKADRHPIEPRERKKRAVSSDPIVCTLCRKTFKYRTALIKHMAGQHGVLPKSDLSHESEVVFRKGIKKPHQCAHCQKRFKSKGSLAKHKLNKHDIASEVDIIVQYDPENSNMEVGGSLPMQVGGDGEPTEPLLKEEVIEEEDKMQEDMTDEFVKVRDSTTQVPHDNISRQVITVDQETGQLILVEASSLPSVNPTKIKDGSSDHGKIISVEGDVGGETDDSQSNQGTVISVQGEHPEIASFSDSVHPTELTTLAQDGQITVTQFNRQVSIGQIVNQNGVPLTSVPIHSVQELTGNQIDFSQGNNEQIVVLLSALNSQNMQDM